MGGRRKEKKERKKEFRGKGGKKTSSAGFKPTGQVSSADLPVVRSFNVLYLLFVIFIYAGILLAVRSVPQIS